MRLGSYVWLHFSVFRTFFKKLSRMDVGARCLDAICKWSFSSGPPASSLLTNEK